MNEPPNQRPPIVVAMEWVSRITTVSLEMVVPGLLGLWVDGHFATGFVFTLLGFAVGLVVAMWHLLKIANTPPKPESPPQVDDDLESK